jgi:hypothetical protein
MDKSLQPNGMVMGWPTRSITTDQYILVLVITSRYYRYSKESIQPLMITNPCIDYIPFLQVKLRKDSIFNDHKPMHRKDKNGSIITPALTNV